MMRRAVSGSVSPCAALLLAGRQDSRAAARFKPPAEQLSGPRSGEMERGGSLDLQRRERLELEMEVDLPSPPPGPLQPRLGRYQPSNHDNMYSLPTNHNIWCD